MSRTHCFGTPIGLLPADVVDYIDRYTPRSLPEPRWLAYRTAVCTVVAATLPVCTTDAKTVLSVVCRMLRWAQTPLGDPTLPQLLQPHLIKRFLAEQADTHQPGSRGNDAGRLQRCVNVLNGQPARTQREPKGPTTPPYNSDELARLEGVAGGNPTLATLLRIGLERGAVIPSIYGASDAVLGVISEVHWHAARRAAADAGVALTAERLRRTYVLSRCSVGSVAQLRDLTRADLDGVREHLPSVDEETTRILLRGPAR